MINNDRIVPVSATDLLSLYGVILQASGKNVTAVAASNPGQFSITATGAQLANEPIATCDFGASSATLYFVPAYNFSGFTVNGVAATVSGDIVADGKTLYTATLASGNITIAKVGF